MRDQLLEVAYAGNYKSKPEVSELTYEFLAGEIEKSKHGDRFGIRDFSLNRIDDDRPSGLDVGYPITVASDINPSSQEKLGNAIGNLLMPERNWNALVKGFKDVYTSDKVAKHRRLGGSVLILSNHSTYADQLEESVASTLAMRELREDSPQYRNMIIAHRLTSLFSHDIIETYYGLLRLENSGDKILEQVILPFASDLQTLPRSNSGYVNFIEKVKGGKQTRTEITSAVQTAFSQVMNLGRMTFFMAGSGQEATLSETDSSVLNEARVGRGTSDMISKGNDVKHAERLLTVPLFIFSNPFTGDLKNPLKPAPTPFVFLEPRFITSSSEVHTTMEEIVAVGNVYKPSGTPNMVYDSPRPDWARKDVDPKIFIAHSV